MPEKREWSGVLEEFEKVHGNKYDYKESNFKNMNTKIVIICPIHGRFEQSPKKHRMGQGCATCNRSGSTETFIQKARAIHGDIYDYSEVSYKHSSQPVKIWCKEHGEFEQMPRTHLSGKGCMDCFHTSRRRPPEEFMEAVRAVHGDIYDYSETTYTTCRRKVTVVCREHGPFKIRPTHLEHGMGCPVCHHVRHCLENHKDPGTDGIVYLVRITIGSRSCIKIGYTEHTVDYRFRSSTALVEPMHVVGGSLRKVIAWEKMLLIAFRGKRAKWVRKKVKGYTECFDIPEEVAMKTFKQITS